MRKHDLDRQSPTCLESTRFSLDVNASLIVYLRLAVALHLKLGLLVLILYA